MITVDFVYLTGIKRGLFSNARLAGDWNGWADEPMTDCTADDGCPGFRATVTFDDSRAGDVVRWGVRLDAPSGPNTWAVMTEVQDAQSSDRYRFFRLPDGGSRGEARYHFVWSRRLGANKHYSAPGARPGARFALWAPNARGAWVVFGDKDRGYIDDQGSGIDPALPVIELDQGADGIWFGDAPQDFETLAGLPYMFRILPVSGAQALYRTDLYSRRQAGRGDVDPSSGAWNGDLATLKGTTSCSVVVDQGLVRKEFDPSSDPPEQVADDEFWRSEFTPGLPVPTRIEDLVVYELHVGALGYPGKGPGTLGDAMALLPYLAGLGVSAVELMPLAEFSGSFSWGYGNTHHFAIEGAVGGRDEYKHFVRECHRNGIAVLQDVVYNHFDPDAARAEWQYDSSVPEDNIYYWYEGRSTDYPDASGGYLDNGSSGFAPRYWAEPVRQMFISSAVQLVEEFHVDGLRVDLTQAIHRDNALHRDGRGVPDANLFGQKLLREWSRTLRTVRPSIFLIAEDHTGWDAVTKSPDVGGLGFGSTWFAEFYHHLIGDPDSDGGTARLLKNAGYGLDGPLGMGEFADRLWRTQFDKVAYHKSHDEAGNAAGTARNAVVAVNGAPLLGATRAAAESRCRVVTGLSILSAATPMFFMGEEIVAQKPYRFDNVDDSKEDLAGERAGNGARMYRFYQDLIRLRRGNAAMRARAIDVIHADDANRVIAFTRMAGQGQVLVVASLDNHPFLDGYVIATDETRLPSGWWQEIFNSDSSLYGGHDVGNYGGAVPADSGRLQLRLPASGFVVLQKR